MANKMASLLLAAFPLLGLVASQGQTTSSDMGPSAFLWPPDRTWSADADNTAPCGSTMGVTNRTKFPLSGGKISLVGQDESWNVQVAISYSQDPKTNDEFLVLVPATSFADFDPGHECLPFPDPKSGTAAGDNATIQIRYLSEFDIAANQTFYACADITYVKTEEFTTNIPCFNVSLPEDSASATASSTPSATSGAAQQTTSAAASESHHKTNVGAIVGGVIGGIAAVVIVAGFIFYRFRQRRAMKQRQHQSLRGVQWNSQFKNRDPSQNSGPSIDLQPVENRN